MQYLCIFQQPDNSDLGLAQVGFKAQKWEVQKSQDTMNGEAMWAQTYKKMLFTIKNVNDTHPPTPQH